MLNSFSLLIILSSLVSGDGAKRWSESARGLGPWSSLLTGQICGNGSVLFLNVRKRMVRE